jgi:hypothetical protein
MGAANPMGAARILRKHASDRSCPEYACAVVQVDEVTDITRAPPKLPLIEDGAPSESRLPRMASTNAYLGADVVARGFAAGAELFITGRVVFCHVSRRFSAERNRADCRGHAVRMMPLRCERDGKSDGAARWAGTYWL